MKHITKYLSVAMLLVAVTTVTIVLARGHSSSDTVCPQTGQTHEVVIENGHASPENTYGKLCDKLTIINKDTVTREMAFGPHEHHVAYDGVAERLVAHDQSLTVTLVQTGLFHFHDHIHDDAEGYFSVSK